MVVAVRPPNAPRISPRPVPVPQSARPQKSLSALVVVLNVARLLVVIPVVVRPGIRVAAVTRVPVNVVPRATRVNAIPVAVWIRVGVAESVARMQSAN